MARLARDVTRAFDYKDVRLLPAQCQVLSRSEVDVSVTLNGKKFNLPIVPANMSTIVDNKLAVWLASHGFFYIMHRFDVDPVAFTKTMHDLGLYSSISLGVNLTDINWVNHLACLDQSPDFITIDIAHGDSCTVTDLVKLIRRELPNSFIIAGNVGTADAVRRLESAGAHAVKVGIAPGSVCTTYPATGFGTRDWQLSAIEWCASAADEALIVADGGIKTSGDIAKSIAFGADMIMAGGIFAAHTESPGITSVIDGNSYKSYFGSASAVQKGESKHVEGKEELIPCRGSLEVTLQQMRESLQSSVSYAGGRSLLDLRNVEYILLGDHRINV